MLQPLTTAEVHARTYRKGRLQVMLMRTHMNSISEVSMQSKCEQPQIHDRLNGCMLRM